MKQDTENLIIGLIIAFAIFVLVITFAAFSYTVIDNSVIATSTEAAYNTRVAIESEKREETAYPPTLQALLTEISTDGQPTSVIPTPAINSQDWLTMWLSKPICQPPCWENITPGETSLSDAVKIITQIPDVRLNETELTPYPPVEEIFVGWSFGQFGDGTVTAHEDGIIVEIELSPNEKSTLTVDDVIKSFREPSSVVRADCFGEWFFPVKCGIDLVFKKIGMVLQLKQSMNMDSSITIHSDDQIALITLFRPVQNSESPMSPILGYYPDGEMKWDGYTTYSFKNKQP